MDKKRQILVVCTGNTCRSPMGAAWLHDLFEKTNRLDKFVVESCGVFAAEGMHPSKGAIDRMQKEGIDISEYRSKTLSPEMVDESELIFCMSHSHQKYIVDMIPKAQEKIIVLNVEDPIGFGEQVYDKCFSDILNGFKSHMGRILEG